MIITRLLHQVIRYPRQFMENRLKRKMQKKRALIYSQLQQEKDKKLAELLNANRSIK